MIKRHKRILAAIALFLSIGTIATITPIVVLDKIKSDKSKDEKSSIKEVVDILNSHKEKVIQLIEVASGNIIGEKENKNAILDEIKKIIGINNLKGTKITISMEEDSPITTSDQTIKINISKGENKEIIESYKVRRIKTPAEKQAAIISYFNETDDKGNKINTNIIISSEKPIITSSSQLLEQIKIVIGEDLTKNQKNSFSISSFESWPKGETKKIELEIQEDAQEKENVVLDVTHAQTKAEKIITTIKKFDKLIFKKTFYISHGLNVNDPTKTLEAIKETLGDLYTKEQKDIIVKIRRSSGSWQIPSTVSNNGYVLELVVDTEKYNYDIILLTRNQKEEETYQKIGQEKEKYDALTSNEKILSIPSNSTSDKISAAVNIAEIEKVAKKLIDPEEGIKVSVKKNNNSLSLNPQPIVLLLSTQTSNYPIEVYGFSVKLEATPTKR